MRAAPSPRLLQRRRRQGYETDSGSRYPVVYLLDANWNFEPVRDLVRFLVAQGQMEPVILVSVCPIQALQGGYGERCLMGHSLAGLFTWYAALGLNDRDEWVDRLRSRGYPRLRLQTATYLGIEHNQSSGPAFREGLTELF